MMAAFMTGREIPMSCGSGDGVLKWQEMSKTVGKSSPQTRQMGIKRA